MVEALADIADGGLIANAGPRFFGFVIGGALPAALGADWLTSAWDQNAALYVIGPAAAVVEEVAGAWLAELFGLPPGVSVGYTTGATMASFTGLAAGRHALLRRAGWDVERHDRRAMRISVSGHATTVEDVDRSLAVITRIAREIPAG